MSKLNNLILLKKRKTNILEKRHFSLITINTKSIHILVHTHTHTCVYVPECTTVCYVYDFINR